jgi:hypothetical protein
MRAQTLDGHCRERERLEPQPILCLDRQRPCREVNITPS